MIAFANVDRVNGLAFVDFHLYYQLSTTVHLQFYSWGLVDRINQVVPGQAYEYVPGVVHFSLEFYHEYAANNEWRKLLTEPSQEMAVTLCSALSASIWNAARANIRFENIGPGEFPALLKAVSRMMAFSNIEHECRFGDWLRERLSEAGFDERTFRAISQPHVTPYTVLLLKRSITACLLPDQFDKYYRGADFLRFHDLTGRETEQEAMEFIASLRRKFPRKALLGRLAKIKAAEHVRRAERAKTLKQISVAAPDLHPVAQVFAALGDHEEARHYWQMRSLRNVLGLAVLLGHDPSTCSLQMLLEDVK